MSKRLEIALIAVLLGTGGYLAFDRAEAWGAERRALLLFGPPHKGAQTAPRTNVSAATTDGTIVDENAGANGSSANESEVADGTVTGEVMIPSLHLSAPVTEGVSRVSLLRGAGHLRGTAVAGGLGNMALAAHRDTFFRPLRFVRDGMHVLVRSAEGTYDYRVDKTEVIDPKQISVLDIRSVPELTLITCYPFDYVGAAPQRFVVHAQLVSLVPQPNP